MGSWVMYPPRGAGQGQSPRAGKAWVSRGNAVPGSCRGRAWRGRPRSLSPDLHSRLLSFGLPGRHCLSCHRCIPAVTTLLSLMLVSGIHAGLCAVCTGPRHLWPLGAKTGRWNGWVEEQTAGQLEHGPGPSPSFIFRGHSGDWCDWGHWGWGLVSVPISRERSGGTSGATWGSCRSVT